MLIRLKPYVEAIWLWFRSLSAFLQVLLVFPVVCAIVLTRFVGSMGLALMGTAIAINSLVVGWVGGVLILILAKAGLIISKDRKG